MSKDNVWKNTLSPIGTRNSTYTLCRLYRPRTVIIGRKKKESAIAVSEPTAWAVKTAHAGDTNDTKSKKLKIKNRKKIFSKKIFGVKNMFSFISSIITTLLSGAGLGFLYACNKSFKAQLTSDGHGLSKVFYVPLGWIVLVVCYALVLSAIISSVKSLCRTRTKTFKILSVIILLLAVTILVLLVFVTLQFTKLQRS